MYIYSPKQNQTTITRVQKNKKQKNAGGKLRNTRKLKTNKIIQRQNQNRTTTTHQKKEN